MVSGLAIAFVACDRCDHSDKVPEVEGLHDHRVRRKLIRVGRRCAPSRATCPMGGWSWCRPLPPANDSTDFSSASAVRRIDRAPNGSD